MNQGLLLFFTVFQRAMPFHGRVQIVRIKISHQYSVMKVNCFKISCWISGVNVSMILLLNFYD